MEAACALANRSLTRYLILPARIYVYIHPLLLDGHLNSTSLPFPGKRTCYTLHLII